MALAGSAGCLLGPRASSQDVASYFMLAPRLSRTPRYSRCSAALATEAQPASTSASDLAQVPAGTLRIGQQKRSDRRDVESLEALWNPISNDDGHAALERLQSAVAAQGTSTGLNVVALSGGTGSALVAYLVASVFEENTVLCIGKSAALQPEKLQRARFVADLLGLDLWELDVRTGLQPAHPRPARVESAARSERAVYSWLNAISTGTRASAAALGDTVSSAVFCGANRDDEENPARCGLACAPELGVAAPLADLSADQVSMLAQALGLPDWGHAAVSHTRPSWTAVQRPTRKLAKLVRTLSKGRISLAAA